MRRRLEVGIAIGADTLAARWTECEWQKALTTGPTVEGFREAIGELGRSIGTSRRVSVAIAILPPLVRVRRLELPRMSQEDARLAVATNVHSYFIGLGESPVCGATIRERRRGRNRLVVAFAADSAPIDNLTIALNSVGWTIQRIVPAHAAWVESVVRQHPRARRGATSITARTQGETDVLELLSGSLSRVRRVRDAAAPPMDAPAYSIGGDKGEPSALVAAGAARFTKGLEFVPDSVRRRRAARDRGFSMVLAAFACANLLGAALTYRRHLDRQLSMVAAKRSAIHARASRALTARDSAEHLAERVTAFAELERSAPRWSAVLSRIALALPEDSDLSLLRAESDSVAVEGQARDAGGVTSAFRRTPGIKVVRAPSPILHEQSTDAVEIWRATLRVDHALAVAHR